MKYADIINILLIFFTIIGSIVSVFLRRQFDAKRKAKRAGRSGIAVLLSSVWDHKYNGSDVYRTTYAAVLENGEEFSIKSIETVRYPVGTVLEAYKFLPEDGNFLPQTETFKRLSPEQYQNTPLWHKLQRRINSG